MFDEFCPDIVGGGWVVVSFDSCGAVEFDDCVEFDGCVEFSGKRGLGLTS